MNERRSTVPSSAHQENNHVMSDSQMNGSSYLNHSFELIHNAFVKRSKTLR